MLPDGGLAANLLLDIDNLLAPPGENIIQVIWGAVEFLGADDQVYVRQTFDEFLSPALSHAAHETQHHVGAAAAHFRRQILHLAKSLLFRRIANAASIEEDNIGHCLAR